MLADIVVQVTRHLAPLDFLHLDQPLRKMLQPLIGVLQIAPQLLGLADIADQQLHLGVAVGGQQRFGHLRLERPAVAAYQQQALRLAARNPALQGLQPGSFAGALMLGDEIEERLGVQRLQRIAGQQTARGRIGVVDATLAQHQHAVGQAVDHAFVAAFLVGQVAVCGLEFGDVHQRAKQHPLAAAEKLYALEHPALLAIGAQYTELMSQTAMPLGPLMGSGDR